MECASIGTLGVFQRLLGGRYGCGDTWEHVLEHTLGASGLARSLKKDKNGVAQEAYQYVLAIYFWPKKESGVEKILESPSNPDTKLNF